MRRQVLCILALFAAAALSAPVYADGDDVPVVLPIEMPSVLGDDARVAEAALRDLGLEVERKTIVGPRRGFVSRQMPAAGALVSRGQRVTIHVGIAAGVKTVVPDFVGMGADAAADSASAAYVVDIRFVDGPKRKSGTVVDQSPAAGRHHSLRGVLTLDVVRRTILVPDLIGRTAAQSRALLERQGLILDPRFVRSRTAEPGTVFAQDPRTGTETVPGGIVSVQIAGERGVQSDLTAPDVRGRLLGDAQRLLTGLGLVPYFDIEVTDRYPHLSVISQGVDPGAPLDVGDRVDLVVALASELPGWTHVPLFLGMTLEDAHRFARRIGLRPKTRYQDSVMRPDIVIGQAPRVGSRRAPGDRIVLSAARPLEVVVTVARVPRVVGLEVDEARTVLLASGIRSVIKRVYAPDRLVGHVVAQSASAGMEIDIGETMVLSCPYTTVVPRLVGGPPSRAHERLRLSDLKGDARGPKPGFGSPKVVRQEVPAGTRVAQGSTIRFEFVYSGMVAAHAIVPDVIGLSREVAIARLGAAGLRASERGPTGIGRTRVLAQSIRAGSRVNPDTTVAITYEFLIDHDMQSVRVPDVAGMTPSEARIRLRAADLTPDVPAVRDAGAVVIRQVPAAGATVRRGALVSLRFAALAPTTVRVPDVVGASIEHAQRALWASGLSGQFSGPSSVGTRRIVSQSPRAGTVVARGTRIEVRFGTVKPVPTSIVIVPNVKGMTRNKAAKTLKAYGFAVKEKGANLHMLGMKSRVKSQSPKAGVLLSRGAQVTIELSL